MNLVKEKITSDLRINGYSIQTLNHTLFLEICGSLGNIINTTQVKLANDHSIRSLLTRPEAIPLHTDHPEIDIIAWYCVNPGISSDNHMLLIDGREVINKLTVEEFNNLMSVRVGFPPMKNGLGGEHPLLSISSGEPRVYYAPWLISLDNSSLLLQGIHQFQRILISSVLIEIALTINTCLFVDNHRILHGRNQIKIDSSRQLERNWIQVV